MRTIDSFAFLIDTVFGELEAASRVEIDCTTANSKENNENRSNLRITAVNGQHSASHYLHFMKHLRAETMENLRETLPQIAPGDMEVFLDQALRRIRIIARSVCIPGDSISSEHRRRMFQWSVRQVQFRCNGKTAHQPQIINDVLVRTRRHAWIFYIVIKKLEDRINCCAGATLNVSVISPVREQKPVYKFRLTCTVAFLGAMLRVLCDRNIVENPNIAELCRRMANSFYTDRQNSLSPHSFRNFFDNPSPEILEKLLEEIRIWEKYTEKFIERQRL
jgi:hypothetical protein